MNDWLTDSELLVMKTVWESEEPLSVQEIMVRTNQKYGKKWKVQTISTFLGLVASFAKVTRLTEEEKERIRRLLDDMD